MNRNRSEVIRNQYLVLFLTHFAIKYKYIVYCFLIDIGTHSTKEHEMKLKTVKLVVVFIKTEKFVQNCKPFSISSRNVILFFNANCPKVSKILKRTEKRENKNRNYFWT